MDDRQNTKVMAADRDAVVPENVFDDGEATKSTRSLTRERRLLS
jgi:hypothetical protein